MNILELMIGVTWLVCLFRPTRRWLWALAVLHAILWPATMALLYTTTWLQAWAVLVSSAQGSLLLWACLTAALLALTARRDWRADRLYRRISLGGLAILWAALWNSTAPRAGVMQLSSPWWWLCLHPIAIFASYASQLLLLGWGTAWLLTRHTERTPCRDLILLALLAQTMGTLIGSWWASSAWGQAWSWDPIECFSLANVIWLASLYSSRGHLTTDWLAWSSTLTTSYTLAASSLIRSGLLGAASAHGYLPTARYGLAALGLGCAGVLLTSVLCRVPRLEQSLPRPFVYGTLLGAVHWLGGLSIALWPGSKPWTVTGALLTWLTALASASAAPLRRWAASGVLDLAETTKRP